MRPKNDAMASACSSAAARIWTFAVGVPVDTVAEGLIDRVFDADTVAERFSKSGSVRTFRVQLSLALDLQASGLLDSTRKYKIPKRLRSNGVPDMSRFRWVMLAP